MSEKKVTLAISNLELHIENHTISNLKISAGDIAWHLDHSFKVINNVTSTLQKSDPKIYQNNFNVYGKLFFFLGFFPRGKGRAPKHVKPPEVILKEDLISQLELAKTSLETISQLDTNAYFKHPLFGNINKLRVYRFLAIHTNHHLKIINDILKK